MDNIYLIAYTTFIVIVVAMILYMSHKRNISALDLKDNMSHVVYQLAIDSVIEKLNFEITHVLATGKTTISGGLCALIKNEVYYIYGVVHKNAPNYKAPVEARLVIDKILSDIPYYRFSFYWSALNKDSYHHTEKEREIMIRHRIQPRIDYLKSKLT